MKKIALCLALLSFITVFSACHPQGVSDGYLYDANKALPWIFTATNCEIEEGRTVKMTISVGYRDGFVEKWKDDVWATYSTNKQFYLRCEIRNTHSLNNSFISVIPLEEFTYSDKYVVRLNKLTSTVVFGYGYEKTLDFSQIEMARGVINCEVILASNPWRPSEIGCLQQNGVIYFYNDGQTVHFSTENIY